MIQTSYCSSIPEALYRIGAFPGVTAHYTGPYSGGNGITRAFSGGTGTAVMWDRGSPDFWRVDGATNPEQVALPTGFFRQPFDGGDTTDADGRICAIQNQNWPGGFVDSEGANLEWPNAGYRPLYWWLNANNATYANYTFKTRRGLSGGSAVATGVDPLDARKLWSAGNDPTLGVAGTPVAGGLNAYYEDINVPLLTNVQALAWCSNAGSENLSGGGYFCPSSFLIYKSTDTGPTWDPGSVFMIRSGAKLEQLGT
jgi:hypothetical protein